MAKKKSAARKKPATGATGRRKTAGSKSASSKKGRPTKGTAKKSRPAKRKPAGSTGVAAPRNIPAPGTRMTAPASGVKVRMYRQGHGDCFLMAFRDDDGDPFYMLIDFGQKKGSSIHVSMTEVAENIRDATGGRIHLAVVTHEHEDHVSGFYTEKEVFETLTIDKLWLAWTEDPDFDLANDLRKKYKDVLLGLVAASNRLNGMGAAAPNNGRTRAVVNSLLEFELSDADRGLAATKPEKIAGRTNKEGILLLKELAKGNDGTKYLRPHLAPETLPKLAGIRVFVLGPPENEKSLRDMDPQGDEQFHFAAAEAKSFLAAFNGSDAEQESHQPFDESVRIPVESAERHEFYDEFYFRSNSRDGRDQAWRRIDGDWMQAAEQFALRMNNFINNTSLVLAIELPKSKKVLLFVGDAQRGNWVSWHGKEWDSSNGLAKGEKIRCSDLLARTVLYKTGHHGSHNATMNKGGLKEMAVDGFAGQFVAMLPANEEWALNSNDPPWRHPLKAIYKELLRRTQGRLFRMDRDVVRDPKELDSADRMSAADWKKFMAQADVNDMYYEYTVEDA